MRIAKNHTGQTGQPTLAPWRVVAVAIFASLAAACGAEGPGAGSGDEGGGPVGAGGAGSASTGAGASGTGAMGGAPGSGGTTSSGPTDCGNYPAGPYGVAEGDVVPPTLAWQGYAPGSDEIVAFGPADFYDCDGSRGINAILVDTSKFECGACAWMAEDLAADIQSWTDQDLGIVSITLILYDPENVKPPTLAGAKLWRDNYGLSAGYVAPDPDFSMVPGNSLATPQISVIDPRTMRVVHLSEGWPGEHPPELEATALANK